MTVETATYISQLNTSYPATGDNKTEGDNHLRLIKSTIKNSFPNITGEVSATQDELNLFHKGGTVSGSLTVKGDLSISGTVVANLRVDTETSASPTATGHFKLDHTRSLKVGTGGDNVNFPTSRAYAIFTGPVLYDDLTANSSAVGTLDYSSYQTGKYIAWENVEGESWMDATGFIDVPKGSYEIDVRLFYTVSSTGSGGLILNLDHNGRNYAGHQYGFVKDGGERNISVQDNVYIVSASGQVSMWVQSFPLRGKHVLSSATLNTKVVVRKI